MRQRLTLLGTATSLALAATIVLAGPAEARRNVGGFDGQCLAPNAAVVQPHGQGLGATCICVVSRDDHTDVLAGPNGPGSTCPPRILSNQERSGGR